MNEPSKESLLKQAQSLAKRRDQNYILRNYLYVPGSTFPVIFIGGCYNFSYHA